jgi:hypothetical protein
MGLGAVVAAAFLVHEPAALVLLYGVAGLLEGPVVARSLHLEALLPEHRRGDRLLDAVRRDRLGASPRVACCWPSL